MITTATKLMAHFMLDCSSKEVSPSHSKSSAPANASINASVTTKNSEKCLHGKTSEKYYKRLNI
jgi:hypothetical protein